MSGRGAVMSRVTEGGVNGELKFPPLPLRSRSALAPRRSAPRRSHALICMTLLETSSDSVLRSLQYGVP